MLLNSGTCPGGQFITVSPGYYPEPLDNPEKVRYLRYVVTTNITAARAMLLK